MIKYVKHPLLGGIDRSMAPLQADRSSFYTLRNLRHSIFQRGVLEQTPYFYQYQAFSQGTYYQGGSQTEPATSACRLVTEDLVVTDYIMRQPAGQLQVLYQTTVPSGESVNTGCRVVINDITALGINLGSTLDIEIDAATTFRWRKNGGAWTAGVACSVSGTDIDGGNATVYFLASSGFTVGHLWAWTRTDRSTGGTSSYGYPLLYTYYKGQLFFNGADDRMMMLDVSSSGRYVITVGYRPVVGSYPVIFDDHLVLGWFQKDTQFGNDDSRANVVGWSDKGDLHNFIPTDTNEADQYTLPNSSQFDITTLTGTPNTWIVGLEVVNQQVYVFTNDETYVSAALGLPLVFSYVKFDDVKFARTYNATFRGHRGCYVIGYNDIYFFNGAEFKSIGKPIIQGTPDAVFELAHGVYDPFRREAIIAMGDLLYVYQEDFGTWYVRKVEFDAETSNAKCLAVYTERVVVGGASLKLYREDTDGTSQPVGDNVNGTEYAKPYLVTQIYGDELALVKELASAYIGAVIYNVGVSTTYYTTGSSVVITPSYWATPGGDFYNATETAAANTWNTGLKDGLCSFPRTNFRGLALALEISGTAAKPAFQCVLTEFGAYMTNLEKAKVER